MKSRNETRKAIGQADKRLGKSQWAIINEVYRKQLCIRINNYREQIAIQKKANQQVEAKVGCAVLNKMPALAKPIGYKITA